MFIIIIETKFASLFFGTTDLNTVIASLFDGKFLRCKVIEAAAYFFSDGDRWGYGTCRPHKNWFTGE